MFEPEDELAVLALDPDPIVSFQTWWDSAQRASNLGHSGSMVPKSRMELLHIAAFATATPDGRPSLRFVRFERLDAPDGFVFLTHYRSRKARELAQNPQAALTFYWSELERQVRVEGPATAMSAEENDAAWAALPLERRAAEAATRPGEPGPTHEQIVLGYDEMRIAMKSAKSISAHPRPEEWGGYRVRPLAMEFWRADEHALHDRFRYERDDLDAPWRVARMWP